MDLAPKERKDSLLTAIKVQSADASQRRLQAMAAAELVRRARLSVKDDPFGQELSAFVSGRRFRHAIGIDAVERERERRDAEAIRGGGA
jgi:hypothetical protein